MKNVVFTFLASLLTVDGLYAQPLPTLLEQRKQLLLNSEIRLRQLTEPLMAMSNAKQEAAADIEEQIRAVRQSVTNSYNQANSAISEKRSQGTIQDISLLGRTGDLGSGAALAGFNMLTRKSKLSGQKEVNESDRKQAERLAQEIRDRKMATIERQFAQQIETTTRPIIAAMNAFFINRPPAPLLPGPSTPASQKFVYVYFGKPFSDRILFSDVWRIDRSGDGSWTKIEAVEEPFEQAIDTYIFKMLGVKPDHPLALVVKANMPQKTSNTTEQPLFYPVTYDRQPALGLWSVLMGKQADYTYKDTFTMGAFTSAEAALQHQIRLMQQAIRANIAVEVVATPPQTTLTDIHVFTDQQDTYWGVRKGAEKPLAAEKSSTQQKLRADQGAMAKANQLKAQQEVENKRIQQDKERQLAEEVQKANQKAEEQRILAEPQKQKTLDEQHLVAAKQKQEAEALQKQEKVAEEKRREAEKEKLASLAQAKAAAPARVSTGATDKNDDFWGDGDSKASPTQTPSNGSYYQQVNALVKIRVKLEANWLEILESDSINQIPRGKYPRNSQGSFEQKGKSFSLGTDQVLTFTDNNSTLKFTPQP